MTQHALQLLGEGIQIRLPRVVQPDTQQCIREFLWFLLDGVSQFHDEVAIEQTGTGHG